MIAQVLRIVGQGDDAKGAEMFTRFKQAPGLLHAYSLAAMDGSEGLVVSFWDAEQSLQTWLDTSPVRKDVDKTFANVTRTRYTVRDSK